MSDLPSRLDTEPGPDTRAQYLTTLVMALVTVLVLAIAWANLAHRHDEALRERFDIETQRISNRIHDRMELYGQILRGAAALFAGSEEVTRDGWKRYVEKLDLDQQALGIQGVGFSFRVPAARLAGHLSEMRQQGFKDYVIQPAGQRDEYTSIIYLEPFAGRNLRAFGYDMFSEPVRRAAMERARDSGTIAFSGKVRLVQETKKDVQAGILAYCPVYANSTLPQTIEQRRAALVGWAYSPYRMNDVMESVLHGDLAGTVRVEVFDGPVAEKASLLYDNEADSIGLPATPPFVRLRNLELEGRSWTLRYTALPGFAAAGRLQPPWVEFAGITLIALLLFGASWLFINTRRRATSMARVLTASLTKSEARYRLVVNNIKEVIFQTDAQGLWTFLNPAWTEVTGFSVEESLGALFLDVQGDDRGFANGGTRPHSRRIARWFAAGRTRPVSDGQVGGVGVARSAIADCRHSPAADVHERLVLQNGYVRRAGRQLPHLKPPFIAPQPVLVPTRLSGRLPPCHCCQGGMGIPFHVPITDQDTHASHRDLCPARTAKLHRDTTGVPHAQQCRLSPAATGAHASLPHRAGTSGHLACAARGRCRWRCSRRHRAGVSPLPRVRHSCPRLCPGPLRRLRP